MDEITIIQLWMVMVDNFHPSLDDFIYMVGLSIQRKMYHNHPKLDSFIHRQIIIQQWIKIYGNYHPFLDSDYTWLRGICVFLSIACSCQERM